MTQQQKIIRTHNERVTVAREIAKRFPVNISRFDMEALVEFLLLEDVHRLYIFNYDRVKAKTAETEEGKFYQEKQLEKIHYVIYMLKACIEVMDGKIIDGDYTSVWKAIHEHQLRVAAMNIKYLDELIKLVEIMLGDIDREALELAQERRERQEFMAELKSNDENTRRVKGLDEYVVDKVAQVVAPQEDLNNIPKNKPNLR